MKLQSILEHIHEHLPTADPNGRIDLRIVQRVYTEQDAYSFLRSYQNFRLKQHAATAKTLTPLPESAISYTNSSEAEEEDGYDPDDFENILNLRRDQGPPIYVILNCEAELVAATLKKHIDDIYMNRRNFHYLIINLNIDDLAIYNLTEFGALNITGFRLLNKSSLNFRQFISFWKSLDPILWPGSGSKNIEVSNAIAAMDSLLESSGLQRIAMDCRALRWIAAK